MKFENKMRRLQLDVTEKECPHKLWSKIYFDAQGNIFQDTICASCGFGWNTMLGYVVTKKSIDVKFTRQTKNQNVIEDWIKHNTQHVLRNFFHSLGKKGGLTEWS